MSSVLVKLGQRGTLTIPKELRSELDERVLFDVVRRDDGVIELRPQTAIDASQQWFWSGRWQQMEHEADEDFAAGHCRRFNDVESFLADLDASGDHR